MTTESAFAPTEDSENSTGYEANTENTDGKKKNLSFLFYYTKVLLPSTKQYLENSNTKFKVLSKAALLIFERQIIP